MVAGLIGLGGQGNMRDDRNRFMQYQRMFRYLIRRDSAMEGLKVVTSQTPIAAAEAEARSGPFEKATPGESAAFLVQYAGRDRHHAGLSPIKVGWRRSPLPMS